MKSYLAMFSIGKNDFEATLRQRMDEHAVVFLPIIEKASQDFLKSLRPALQSLLTGHFPLDADG
jgi:hypothetical protein